ncbi:MAG TPA: hypothetical protein VN282_26335 [Pyrinomonadaceae bacterium]|nr:hypothetical protein [Pyrinomonadaceae bacterium]
MITGLPVLEETDWSRLHHAYGRATDTPGHLRALLKEDAEGRKQAFDHLWSAIIHQGTPWTATGPVALFIAGLLRDETRARRVGPIRADLFEFLLGVAHLAGLWEEEAAELERTEASHGQDLDALIDAGDDETLYDGTTGEAAYARALLGCVRAAPALMAVMLEGLTDADPVVRAHASAGAVALARCGPMRGHLKEFETRLTALARTARDADERCAHVLALGDLGAAPTDFLEDPSPAVRICAALTPGLAGNAAATLELLDALKHHAVDIDGWFTNTPPQFSLRPRFSVVARLVEQVKDFEMLADAAVAVLPVTTKYTVDYDWGPLLAAAFPDGSGVIKTEAQHRFLAALVDRKLLWDPKFWNARAWFEKAGLPYDRQACAELVRNFSR